ncbi:MAG: DUF4199 domain-containing protein [Bacteroidota bacterium]
MKKNVIVFGLISGLIVSAFMVVGTMWCYPNFEGSMVLGYAGMLLSFSMVFVGIKNYRDKYNGGIISLGKALQIGLYISLVASTCYVVAWLIEYYVFIPDFMDKYSAHMLLKAQNSGVSAAELAVKTKEIVSMKDMYKSPIMVILFTYAEILPIGLVVTLISALILKRKISNGGGAVAVS